MGAAAGDELTNISLMYPIKNIYCLLCVIDCFVIVSFFPQVES